MGDVWHHHPSFLTKTKDCKSMKPLHFLLIIVLGAVIVLSHSCTCKTKDDTTVADSEINYPAKPLTEYSRAILPDRNNQVVYVKRENQIPFKVGDTALVYHVEENVYRYANGEPAHLIRAIIDN